MKKYISYILLLLPLQFLCDNTSAQVSDTITLTQTQTIQSPQKDGFFKKLISGIFNPKIKYDTNYIDKPYGKFMVALNQNFSQHNYYQISNGEVNTMKNGLTVTTGLSFAYKGVGLGYSVNFRKLSKKTADKDIYFKIFTNRFGIELNIFNVNNLYHPKLDYTVEGSYFKGGSIGAYYVLNDKKFSYPAPFSFSKIQKKSAGSVILGLSYYNDRLNYGIGEKDVKEILDLIADVANNPNEYRNEITDTTFVLQNLLLSQNRTQYISVSVGYAYNFVFAKDWLFHVSLQPSLMPWQKTVVTSDSPTIRMKTDEEGEVELSITDYERNDHKVPYYFWNFGCKGKASLTYSWKRGYVSASYISTMSYIKIPEMENLIEGKNALMYRWWNAKLSVGFRF